MFSENFETHQTFINVANQIKDLSKCQFTKVACIFVNESGRINATGVNGTISGTTNCCDTHFDARDDHVPYSHKYELHAEMNTILDLARSGLKPSKLTVYTTLSPCQNCLKHLCGLVKLKGVDTLHIDRIVYAERYHRFTEDDVNEMKQYALMAGIKLSSIEDLRNELQS